MPTTPPTRSPILAVFAVAVALIVALVQLDFIELAYERIGIAPQYVFALLIGSLLGSSINLPIGRLGDPAGGRGTILAVNLGGAIIPALTSAYLVARNAVYAPAALATAFAAVIVHWMARPVPQVGIAVPIFIPPIVAAGLALLLAPDHAPAVAYVAGTLGTLIGADLTNLNRLRGLGAPVASIGGAGTFDGIFVTGILAVLLA
jgi:uncharacterized membrane protein